MNQFNGTHTVHLSTQCPDAYPPHSKVSNIPYGTLVPTSHSRDYSVSMESATTFVVHSLMSVSAFLCWYLGTQTNFIDVTIRCINRIQTTYRGHLRLHDDHCPTMWRSWNPLRMSPFRSSSCVATAGAHHQLFFEASVVSPYRISFSAYLALDA